MQVKFNLLGVTWLLGCSYSPALAVPPGGWSVPPRPQPWFPPHPAVSVPPPHPGAVQQPLFPVQNVRPPLPSSTIPSVQPSLTTAPPGLPPATSIPPSQPLFPVVANTIPSHNLPFSVSMLSTNIPSSSPIDLKSLTDGSNSSVASNYHVPGNQGLDSPPTI